MTLTLLYRGPLASCNYACGYCPFAKRRDSKAQLERDREALERFVEWIAQERETRWRVVFTPWGEALVRSWYRDAMQVLSHLPQIETVAAQTNLACGLDWIDGCRTEHLALWATFHPTECPVDDFARKVAAVRDRGVWISVGAVGVVAHLPAITELRERLLAEVALWINAQQPRPRPYQAGEIAALTAIDPQFGITLCRQRSLGRACRTGESAFTVDGAGEMRRCHFVDERIGNIYEAGWREALRPRTCPKPFCGCYLGVSQLDSPELATLFDGAPERLPGLSRWDLLPTVR